MTRKLSTAAIVALLVLGSVGVVGQTFAAVTAVTGTIVQPDAVQLPSGGSEAPAPAQLSGTAVAVVTLVDPRLRDAVAAGVLERR